jgi:putative Mg2+ transporter-C (MgtC) family protein
VDTIEAWVHAYLLPLGAVGEGVLRLVVAAVLGGLVGIEREVRGRQAGFRTYILVCLGSALTMVVSIRLAELPWFPKGAYGIQVDPGRIAYGIMTGVGFLGAGAILKHGVSIRGLTTAAGLWCVAAVGLATGSGQYVLSATAVLLVLTALWVLDYVESIVPKRRFRDVVVRVPWKPGCVRELVRRVEEIGVRVLRRDFRRIGDLSHAEVKLTIGYSENEKLEQVESSLPETEGYQVISSERA